MLHEEFEGCLKFGMCGNPLGVAPTHYDMIRVSGFSGLDIPSFQHKRGELEEWLSLSSESRSFQFIYAALLSVFRAVQYRSVLVMDGLDTLSDSALLCLLGVFLRFNIGLF